MLQKYQNEISTIQRESDFYEFWDLKLRALRDKKLILKRGEEIRKNQIVRKSFFYNSIDDKMISGNLFIPETINEKLPVIVMYHGLGANTFGDDYFSLAEKTWLSKGFIVIGFDVRGQNGKTEFDQEEDYSNYGLYCRNIMKRDQYYYVKTYLDAIRLLDVVEALEETSGKKIICNGGSQGGAITLAVASLDRRPIAAFADIPSCSDVKYMVSESSGGFKSINTLLHDNPDLKEQVMKTLSYIDTCNLVSMIQIPILCSVGTLDKVCPPEGFYQAYRQIKSEKYLEIYEGFGHGGYDHLNFPKKLQLIEKILS